MNRYQHFSHAFMSVFLSIAVGEFLLFLAGLVIMWLANMLIVPDAQLWLMIFGFMMVGQFEVLFFHWNTRGYRYDADAVALKRTFVNLSYVCAGIGSVLTALGTQVGPLWQTFVAFIIFAWVFCRTRELFQVGEP